MSQPRPAVLALAIGLALCGPALTTAAMAANPTTISATPSAGVLSGIVRDAARGSVLQGARITIAERVLGTDREGRFSLRGLQAGRYAVTVDFVGYASQTVEVELGSDAGARIELRLTSTTAADAGVDADALEAIEVRGTRESQALALNLQRSSENYKNVVSADLLGRFPDRNLAESTQRIPGVSIERDQGEGRYVNVRGAPLEFTSVTIDGVQVAAPNPARRAVELDTVPADVIAALEVTKALTPDMDGDAIAGQINIVTQSALDTDRPIFRGSIGSGRFELGSGDNDSAALTLGNQFGAEGNLGLLLSASGSRAGRFTDNVETSFFRAADGRILPELTEIKDYEGTRTRNGLTLRGDARIDENHLLYLIASASKFRDKEYRNLFGITFEQHRPDATDRGGTIGRATFDKEIRERIQEQRIRTLNLGGEHWVNDWTIDWQASRSVGEFDIPARQQLIYRATLRPPFRYDYSDPDFPTYTLLNADGSVRQQGINLAEGLYAFRRYNQRLEDAEETETGLRVDFSHPQSFLGHSGEVSFGLRARLRDKDSNDDRNRNSVAAGTPGYTTLLCPRVSNNFGRFEFGRVYCNDVFERFGSTVQNANLLPLVADSLTNDYQASEDIRAAYVRLDARWDQLSFVGGLRYEHTDIDSRGIRFSTTTQQGTPVVAGNSDGDLLPSLHFRYELTPDSIVRWSYSTGLSRPNYPDTAPRFVLDDNARSATAGNPDLKTTYSHNLDVSWEYYLRPLGLVSVAAFHKRLEDPIFIGSSTLGTGAESIRVTRPENGDNGQITGLELAWQQTFDQLPAPFDGLGVYANYTLADSEADLPFGIGKTELPGTSRHNVNFAVFYEKHGINTRLAYNSRSEFIQEFDAADRGLDVYWDQRELLDFTASYQITPQWTAWAEINNLTDTKQRRYQGVSTRVLELEQFGRAWQLGLRFEY
ncbi:MAG: TonB-dependent receptor [Xanthomonadales bacterium]|jgi:TonB-dependent receptor|nr:TonB-dependent receptor [Xanthomonadales bacterium]